MRDYGDCYDHSHHATYSDAVIAAKEIIRTSIFERGASGVEEWWLFGETARIIPMDKSSPCERFDDVRFVHELCGVEYKGD